MLSANKPLAASTFRQLTLLLCLVGLAVVLLAFYIAQVRSAETLRSRMEQVNITNRNSAKVVEENLRLVLTGTDTVLQLMKLDMETLGTIDETHKQQLSRLREQYEINAIIVRDENGNALFSEGTPVLPAAVARRQDFFQAHQQYEGQGLYLGTVMAGESARAPSITLTRRINDKAGNFKGVVSARLAEDNLVGIYNELEQGEDKSILLLRRDRTFLSRFPQAPEWEFKPGYFDNHPAFRLMGEGKSAEQYETKSEFTGQDFISAYRAMQDYPVVVIAATLRTEALADVHAASRVYLLESAAFAVLTIVAFGCIWWQMRKQMALAFVIKKERSLLSATMLAIHEGIVVTDQTGKIILMNTMAQILTGRSETTACGCPFSDVVRMVDGDKKQSVVRFVDQVLATGKSQYLFDQIMLVDAQGMEYSIDGSMSPVMDEENMTIGLVFSFRDVSEAKQKQKKIEYLSQHDQLTGLFNRHFLEEIIGKKVENAKRYGQSLCMIIFDLDRFKRVNDIHGHPVGDKVLKQTAQLSLEALRKADIVARLGGEEFIIVLPQTDISGGMEAAEKIRALLELYTHPLAGCVTASFGVAAWRADESFQDWYKRADAAMYSAKQSGRNRVVNAETQPVLPVASVVLIWQRDWESGNSQIDEQHKALLEAGNRLIHSSLSGLAQEQLLKQAHQVLGEVIKHFAFEESVIRQAAYPDSQRHAEIHKGLVDKAMRLEKELVQGRIKAAGIFSFLVDDIVMGHMLGEDVKFFPYLRK